MIQLFGAQIALGEDVSSTRQLMTVYNSSSGGSETLFWPP